MDTFLMFLLVGALAQAIDGALGMAYGVISSSVLLAFGVPPMLLGLPGDNNYANYAEANRALWRLSVLPLAATILDGLGFDTATQVALLVLAAAFVGLDRRAGGGGLAATVGAAAGVVLFHQDLSSLPSPVSDAKAGAPRRARPVAGVQARYEDACCLPA